MSSVQSASRVGRMPRGDGVVGERQQPAAHPLERDHRGRAEAARGRASPGSTATRAAGRRCRAGCASAALVARRVGVGDGGQQRAGLLAEAGAGDVALEDAPVAVPLQVPLPGRLEARIGRDLAARDGSQQSAIGVDQRPQRREIVVDGGGDGPVAAGVLLQDAERPQRRQRSAHRRRQRHHAADQRRVEPGQRRDALGERVAGLARRGAGSRGSAGRRTPRR